MKILVTGANGMLGQDLCPVLEDEEYEVVETDIDNLDITDELAVRRCFNEEKPDMVIHCAAYTDVDGAESDFEKALLVNEKGTEYIAKASSKLDIPVVYISTDYVFDGEKSSPYTPTDKPNPINKYGLSKLKGEEALMSCSPKFYILRTSWLYGHHGDNFVEKMISLKNKEELKVVDDQIGSPTWTVDLVDAILDLIEEEPPYGIYHISGGGQTSWHGFAKEIFSQLGENVNLIPCTTEEFKRPAKRPLYSVLDNDDCCRDWKLALKDYLNLRSE